MDTRLIVVKTIEGIDARYAAEIITLVRSFEVDSAFMVYKGSQYNLKSILSIVSAQVCYGGEIEVKIEGKQSLETLDAIELFLGGLKNA